MDTQTTENEDVINGDAFKEWLYKKNSNRILPEEACVRVRTSDFEELILGENYLLPVTITRRDIKEDGDIVVNMGHNRVFLQVVQTQILPSASWDHWPSPGERVEIVSFCGKIFSSSMLKSEELAGKKGTILLVDGGLLHILLNDGGDVNVSICCTKPIQEKK